MNKWFITLLFLSLPWWANAAPPAKRALLDIADVQGMRTNQLVGYGLVVGLSGTGDRSQVKFTGQSMANIYAPFCCASNRKRSAFSLIKPAASFWS